MNHKLLNQLDVPYWRALYFTEAGSNSIEPNYKIQNPDNPKIVRREQWVVAGDSYVYMQDGYGPVMGEQDEAKVETLDDVLDVLITHYGNDIHNVELHPVLNKVLLDRDKTKLMLSHHRE